MMICQTLKKSWMTSALCHMLLMLTVSDHIEGKRLQKALNFLCPSKNVSTACSDLPAPDNVFENVFVWCQKAGLLPTEELNMVNVSQI